MPSPTKFSAIAFAVAGAGISTFAGMDVVMKGLSLSLGAYNAMLWRSLISVSLAGLLYLMWRPAWPAADVIRLHLWRGFIISIMAFLFFWGLKYLPVAEAIGLSFIAPLLALYLAAVILKENIGKQAIAASVIGLVGAAIIVSGRLGGNYEEETGKGIAAILLSAVLYAYNIILQRQQALLAGPVEIAFFQNSTIIVLFASLSPFFAQVPAIGVVGLCSSPCQHANSRGVHRIWLGSSIWLVRFWRNCDFNYNLGNNLNRHCLSGNSIAETRACGSCRDYGDLISEK